MWQRGQLPELHLDHKFRKKKFGDTILGWSKRCYGKERPERIFWPTLFLQSYLNDIPLEEGGMSIDTDFLNEVEKKA